MLTTMMAMSQPALAMPPTHPCEPFCELVVAGPTLESPGGFSGWTSGDVTVSLDDGTDRTNPVSHHIEATSWAIDESNGVLVPAGAKVLSATLTVTNGTITKVYDLVLN